MAGPLTQLGGPEEVARLIQVALTPVFLLSGIGTLINMFNQRQNRVSDHLEHLNDLVEQEQEEEKYGLLLTHLIRLRRRRVALDAAIIFSAIGAVFTCAAALALFLGSVRDAQVATWLEIMFGAALGCTVVSLIFFVLDTMMAWHGLRREGPMPRSKPN
jgi:hypothetical protein